MHKTKNELDGVFSVACLPARYRKGDTAGKELKRPLFVKEGQCWRCINIKAHNGVHKVGKRSIEGYPLMQLHGEQKKLVEWIWVSLGRELGDEDYMLHRCDNSWCCNPDHVYLGDAQQNSLDRSARKPGCGKNKRGRMSVNEVVRIREHNGRLIDLAREMNISERVVSRAYTGYAYSTHAYQDGKKVELPKRAQKQYRPKNKKRSQKS